MLTFEILKTFIAADGKPDLTYALKDEVQFLERNVNDELMAMPEFTAYVEAVNALANAYRPGADVADEVAAVLATEAGLMKIAGVTATPSPAAVATPNLHTAAALEDLLPAVFRGAPIHRFSFGPSTWASIDETDGAQRDALQTIAEALGGDIQDLSMAAGNTGTPPVLFNVLALQMHGVSGPTLLETYVDLALQTELQSTRENVTIDGRELVHLLAPANPLGGMYMFASGDTLLAVQTNDLEVATELLASFP